MNQTLLIFLLAIATVFAQSNQQINTDPIKSEHKDANALTPISVIQPVAGNYVIGPGDFFEISADDQSFVVQVSPEGYITLNRLGGIKVGGFTLDSAKQKIMTLISLRFRADRSYVQLSKQRVQSIGVFGAVKNPSYADVPASAKLSQVLQFVGGPLKSACLDSILLIHATGDTEIVDLYAIRNQGQTKKDPYLYIGDHIYVPKIDYSKPMINILKDGNPSPVIWHRNYTIKDYLDREDSFEGAQGLAGVFWATTHGRKFISIAEAAISKPEIGDTIDIWLNQGEIYVGGMVHKAGPQAYVPKARPIYYIYAAGTEILADQLDRIRVVRKNGKFEYIDPINGDLFPGDYIELDMMAVDNANKYVPIISAFLSAATLGWLVYSSTILKH